MLVEMETRLFHRDPVPNAVLSAIRSRPPIAIWLVGFIAVALIGGSLTVDMTGQSAADQYILARWSFEGLRIYLWLEAGVLVAIVAALGFHVVSTGLAVTGGAQSRMFGTNLALHPRVPRQTGYIFVVLGAALVALSLTTLVLFNSCVYMRLI
jgi:hypothetical protein